MYSVNTCGLGTQTLDTHLQGHDLPDPMMLLLSATASACKRLQHLAIISASFTRHITGAALPTAVPSSIHARLSGRGGGCSATQLNHYHLIQ